MFKPIALIVLLCCHLLSTSSHAEPLLLQGAELQHSATAASDVRLYMTISNPNSEDLAITAIHSIDFNTAKLIGHDGQQLAITPTLNIPANSQIQLADNSFFLHLSQPPKPLDAGEYIIIEFEDSQQMRYALTLVTQQAILLPASH